MDLPPLMFTRGELTALVLGARLVRAWGGAENVIAANHALQRIEAVVPPDLRNELDAILLFAPEFQMKQELRERLDALHSACLTRRVVRFKYTREDGVLSERGARSPCPRLLERRLDARRLVRAAPGVSQLPHRPHGRRPG